MEKVSKMIDKEKIQLILRGVIWDYNIDPYLLYLISLDKKPAIGNFNKKKAFLRIIERLSWYELLQIYDIKVIKENLTEDVIKEIRNQTLRTRYEILYQILRGRTLPSAGWNPENRKRLEASLLSDRRYSA